MCASVKILEKIIKFHQAVKKVFRMDLESGSCHNLLDTVCYSRARANRQFSGKNGRFVWFRLLHASLALKPFFEENSHENSSLSHLAAQPRNVSFRVKIPIEISYLGHEV